MSMTVTLVSGAYPDNRQHQGIYASAAAQTSYFDSLDKLTRECKIVPLGADIYFSGTIEELRGRSYGWIDYGDGFRYYFSIYDFDFVSTETTRILYKLDIYETYLFHGLRFGRAALERAPQDIGRPMMSIGYDSAVPEIISSWKGWHVGVTGWSSSHNKLLNSISTYYMSTDTGVPNPALLWLTGHAHEMLWDDDEGDWVKEGSDMVSAKVFPRFVLLSDLHAGQYRTKYNGALQVRTQDSFIVGERAITEAMTWYVQGSYSGTVLSHTREWCDEIRDMRGNVIYRPDFGQTFTIDDFLMYQSISNSSEFVIGHVQDAAGGDLSLYIPVPGEPLDQVIETWNEYYYRQRDYDIESRQLQNQKQLVQSLANVGSSAMGGAIGGEMAGVGAGLGQAAGIISSIVGSVANYATNELIFDPKEQQIKDEQMKKAVDSVNFGGSAEGQMLTTSSSLGNSRQGVFRMHFNTASQISEDIRINGYPVDFRGDMPQLSEGAWKGQVEVLDLPGAWRDQVMQRFAGGVVIGRLG